MMLLLSFGYVQAQEKCGFDAIMDLNKTAYPDFAQKVFNMQTYISNQISNGGGSNFTAPINNATGTKVIPVLVHIVRETANSPTISYAQVESQIDALNAGFNNNNTGIQFCLVSNLNTYTVSSNGVYNNAQPGVIRYVSSTIANNNITVASTNALSAYCPPAPYDQVLNIWVVKSIDGFCGSNIIRGYSPLPLGLQVPSLNGINLDGVVITEAVFGSNTNGNTYNLSPNYSLCADNNIRNQGKVLVHEVGHYLNLWHTFQPNLITNASGCFGAGVNTDGDFCADTDPVNVPANTFVGGGIPPINSCNNTPTQVDNYMYYSNDVAWNTFTTGQSQIMNFWLQNHRSGLFANANNYKWGLISTGATCRGPALFADFILPATVCIAPNANSTFTITPAIPTANPNLNTAVSFSWTVTDPNSVSTGSTGPNLIYNFTLIGTYTISCVATDINVNTISFTQITTASNCSILPDYVHNSHWYYGKYVGLDFSTGTPVLDYAARNNETIKSFEGAFTYSDDQGQLLFYTDGVRLWNGNHVQINNSLFTDIFNNALPGLNTLDICNGNQIDIQSHHGIIACPYPGHSNQFILFNATNGENSSPFGNFNLISYVIINLNLNTVSLPNNLPAPPTDYTYSEGINLIPHCNGTDFWLIGMSYRYTLSAPYPYIISSFLINNLGVSSSFNNAYGTINFRPHNQPMNIKCNSKNNKIIFNGINDNKLTLFDFNNSTGAIYNKIIITIPISNQNTILNSATFTNNNPNLIDNIIYTTFDKATSESFYNKTNLNFTSFQQFGTDLFSSISNSMYLQNGPNGNLYISRHNINNYHDVSVGEVLNPNSLSPTFNKINFNTTQQNCFIGNPDLNWMLSKLSFPNLMDGIQPAYTPPSFTTAYTSCNTISLTVPSCWGGYSYDIDWGDGTTHGYSATAVPTNMPHTYATNGTYSITVSFIPCGTTVIPIGAIQVTNTITINSAGVPLTISGVASGCVTNTLPSTYSVPTVAGATAYNWSISGGGTILINAPYGPVVDIDWTASGTYTISLTLQQGACTSTSTKVVSVLVGPSVSLTQADLCVPTIFTATSTASNLNYTWSGIPSGAGTTVTAGLVSTYTATIPGLYIITVTNANGCVGSATANITAPEPNFCCTPYLAPKGSNPNQIWLDNQTASTSTLLPLNNYTGKQFFVTGVLTIDKNMTFSNCAFYFTANASINIVGTNTVFKALNNSKFQAVCNKMWNGIYSVNATHNITIDNCTLRDMISGVWVQNGPTITVTNNKFYDNYTGMGIVSNSGMGNELITNNLFTSINPTLLPPYNNEPRTVNGIACQRTKNLTIGDASGTSHNSFINCSNGIYHMLDVSFKEPIATVYGVHSVYNIFNNIIGGPNLASNASVGASLYKSFYGAGIYCGYTSNTKHKLFCTTNLTSENDNFELCQKAIVTNACFANILANKVKNCEAGFLNSETDLCHYEILKNELTGVHLGIQMVGNTGFRSTIENNKIKLNQQYIAYNMPIGAIGLNGQIVSYYPMPFALWPIGIDVQQLNPSFVSDFYIGDRTIGAINADFIDNGGYRYSNDIEIPGKGGTGIRLNNTNCGLLAKQNRVRFTTSDNSYIGIGVSNIKGENGRLYGMYVTNATATMFEENKIISDNNTTNFLANRYSEGFHIQESKQLTMACNTMARSHYGICAIGNNFTDEPNIRANSCQDHKIGWLFRSLTLNPGAFGANIGISQSLDNNNTWNGTYYKFGTNDNTKVMRVTTSAEVIIPRAIIVNSSNTTILDAESKSNQGVNGRYRILDFEVVDQFNECHSPNPEPFAPDGGGGLSTDEALTIASTGGYIYPIWDEVADFGDKAYLYKVLDKNEALRNSQTVLDNFYDNKTPENLGKLVQNEKLLALLADSTINADTVALDSVFAIVNTRNASIVNNGKSYENAEKWIMNINTKIVATGISSLNENEILNIQVLASSCPAMMGASVYKARSIDAMLHPGVQYYDYDLCAAVLPQNKTGVANPYNAEDDFLNSDAKSDDAVIKITEITNKFELYPNPVQRNSDVTLSYAIDAPATLSIYDMVGKMVMQLDLNIKAQRVSFNIGNIVAGIYKIKIASANRTLKSFKLNVF
jgi:uncharacterized protein YxjI